MAKRPGVTPTGVAYVPRRLISKAVMRLFKNELTLGAGALQLSAIHDARVKAVSHYASYNF